MGDGSPAPLHLPPCRRGNFWPPLCLPPSLAQGGAPRLEPCQLSDFEMGRVLGTGSFGRVSLARHRPTGTVVAIKALSKAHIVRQQQLAHLRSERDILRQLDHPLLVRMHGCCQDAACVYFVMEYVPGL